MPLNFVVEPSCEYCAINTFCRNAQEASIATQRHHLKKKQQLPLAQAKFKSLYAVQSGALKAYTIDPHGREIIHEFYFQNEICGYEAIASGAYHFSVQALSDTVLCEVSYDSFLQLMQRKPLLIKEVLFSFSRQLSFDADLKICNAHERVLAFLYNLAERLSPCATCSVFKLPMPYSDIGQYLGLTTETVNRVLSQLRQENKIYLDNKQITLISPKI